MRVIKFARACGAACAIGLAALSVCKAAEADDSAALAAFFHEADREIITRTPLALNYRGVREQLDEWDNLSAAWAEETNDIRQKHLAALKDSFQYDALNEEDKLSYRLFEYQWSMEMKNHDFRYHAYPASQMSGVHAGVATHLTTLHLITSVEDAEAYIARLGAVPAYLRQLAEHLKAQAERGVLAPKFTFDYAIEVNANLISGAPYDADAPDNVLYKDFKEKLAKLDIPEETERDLVARAESALRTAVKPGFEALNNVLSELSQNAAVNGVWALPDGDAYYRHQLNFFTSTDMTPDEIHELGLREIDRLHAEIKDVMAEVGFEGSLQEFFAYTLESPEFYFPNTEAGKAEAIEYSTALVDGFKKELDRLFITKPKADVVVRPVEAFREKTEGAAFYRRGAADGSRPGIYYLNTYNTKNMPKWEMPALAYHEAIPGHHMQRSIGQEMEHLPNFRRFVRYEAYTEGWGLYSELLPKEIGYYTDPYENYGRLTMELLRACRLAADTGLHHKRWTREETIAFLMENYPTNRESAVKSVERYLVKPGQATAYKIGMLKILELRGDAQRQLGDAFSIREFHDVVLRNSQVPLHILEDIVNDWVADTLAQEP